MNQVEFDRIYGKVPADKESEKIKAKIKKVSDKDWYKERLFRFIPILEWLPKYDFKKNLIFDFIGGITVGIMHVPQGMAYATLAGVEPVYGLYSSFFAATIYLFFGTSRHISVGTFAVASMMVGAVRFKLIPEQVDSVRAEISLDHNFLNISDIEYPEEISETFNQDYGVMTLMSTLTLGVGIIQLLMGIFRLSFLTTYISDQLISGYTTATALHVLVSQLNKILGLKLPRYSGNGTIFLMLRDMFLNIHNTNLMTLGISVFGLILLYVGKEYINPMVKKRIVIPIPFDLILIVIGIAFSSTFEIKKDYNVKIVNNIPRGLPSPSFPRLDLLPQLIFDCIPIAIICYMFVVSLGKLFSRKHGYKIDPTQELFALGITEIVSSILPVYPAGAALSRSSVCEASGVRSQLYNVFSGTLILTVIIWIGPVVEPLPMCILSCIVIISLKSLLLQVTQLPRLWKVSKFDFAIWTVSFLSTVSTTVTFGLFISLSFVLFTIVLRQQWPKFQVLGTNETKTVFASKKKYSNLNGISSEIILLKFESPLHFVNVSKFLDVLNSVLENPGEELEEVKIGSSAEKGKKITILDCSAISFVDTMGVDAIVQMYTVFERKKTRLIFAGFCSAVLETLDQSGSFKIINKDAVFPSVIEAINNIGL
ncbi:hypothetical protein FO519_005160 [Halicephalobus sp. NKZ332]|nr:hypothetical protein FO519_005160 [Halicephalobus sp. NKZ332]